MLDPVQDSARCGKLRHPMDDPALTKARSVSRDASLNFRRLPATPRGVRRLVSTWFVWQCRPIPPLSGLLAVFPSTSWVRLPSASADCCDSPKAVSFHHRTDTKRLMAHGITEVHVDVGVGLELPPADRVGRRSAYFKMPTAYPTTSSASNSEMDSSTIIRSLAHGLIADTSVGLNAVAAVNDRCR